MPFSSIKRIFYGIQRNKCLKKRGGQPVFIVKRRVGFWQNERSTQLWTYCRLNDY
jgi:hypothetical protein